MSIITAGHSDIGLKRKTNQDSLCLSPKHLFFAVADGMGGHQGGDIASQTAAKLMPEFFDETTEEEPESKLTACIKHINKNILEIAAKNKELAGMGTTISGIQYKGPNLYVVNVGDSRCYLIHEGQLYQLSRDHSLVQEKVSMGIYSREMARYDEQKNVLVRTVGFDPDVDVDVFRYKVCKNDIFILCTDGLHGLVGDQAILDIVNQHLPDPAAVTMDTVKQAVHALIQKALDNGGKDNVSVIISVAHA
ncbi:MAG: Stp1/IreP family PP2C-type Ser/Thr phosphatase [Bacteriovoracaceae bacterium]|nr:Stp1/IreP family PP2C-type Ser/Thr phosphatase [Bacteriovoracaceae bacterium]